MRKPTALLCGMFVLTAILSTADAAPSYIPLQGVLTDANGMPLYGPVDICFTIYDAETGGNDLWNETQTVTVDNGLFTVYLGEVEPLDLSIFRDNDDLWLGTTVGDDPEMPRVRLGSAPFSGFAEHCGNMDINGETGGIQYNGLKDFRLVYRDDFENAVEGWYRRPIQSAIDTPFETTTEIGTGHGTTQILGGVDQLLDDEVFKSFDLTSIPHSEVLVRLDYYALDSWDSEWAYAWASNGGAWNVHIKWDDPGRRTQFTGTGGVHNDAVYAVELRGPHSANEIIVGAGSTLDETAPGNESFGIDNVEIWVR